RATPRFGRAAAARTGRAVCGAGRQPPRRPAACRADSTLDSGYSAIAAAACLAEPVSAAPPVRLAGAAGARDRGLWRAGARFAGGPGDGGAVRGVAASEPHPAPALPDAGDQG